MASISTETPLFMRKDADKIITQRRNELTIFLRLLTNKANKSLVEHLLANQTLIGFQGDTEWANDEKTTDEFVSFMLDSKHCIVDGKQWNCGFLGSRWADTKLNGKKVRIAFYSKATDPSFWNTMRPAHKPKNYVLIVNGNYFN